MGWIIDNLIFTRKFYFTNYVVSYPTYVRDEIPNEIVSCAKELKMSWDSGKGNSGWKSNDLWATDAGV